MALLEGLDKAAPLLAAAGIALSDRVLGTLERHLELVRERNAAGGLVSRDEVERLEVHVWDSLGLAPYIDGTWVDIGPGGGFPLVPVVSVRSDVTVCALERSTKKAGMLIGMLGKLGMAQVEVLVGEFPAVGPPWVPGVVTARAVERPEHLWKSMAKWVEAGSTFLCQSDPEWWRGRMFHVEHVNDEWQAAGLRRGKLYRVVREMRD